VVKRILACRGTHDQGASSEWTRARHKQIHKTAGGVLLLCGCQAKSGDEAFGAPRARTRYV